MIGAQCPGEKVTVAALLQALASYPLDAEVVTVENGVGGGELLVEVDGELVELWAGHDWARPNRCERVQS